MFYLGMAISCPTNPKELNVKPDSDVTLTLTWSVRIGVDVFWKITETQNLPRQDLSSADRHWQ